MPVCFRGDEGMARNCIKYFAFVHFICALVAWWGKQWPKTSKTSTNIAVYNLQRGNISWWMLKPVCFCGDEGKAKLWRGFASNKWTNPPQILAWLLVFCIFFVAWLLYFASFFVPWSLMKSQGERSWLKLEKSKKLEVLWWPRVVFDAPSMLVSFLDELFVHLQFIPCPSENEKLWML